MKIGVSRETIQLPGDSRVPRKLSVAHLYYAINPVSKQILCFMDNPTQLMIQLTRRAESVLAPRYSPMSFCQRIRYYQAIVSRCPFGQLSSTSETTCRSINLYKVPHELEDDNHCYMWGPRGCNVMY